MVPTSDFSLWKKIQKEKYNQREEVRKVYLTSLISRLRAYFYQLHPDSVYLTGSILQEGHFYDFSDVDIAVKGLKGNYFKVLSDLEEITGREVDLIEMEKCRFSQNIETRGLRIV